MLSGMTPACTYAQKKSTPSKLSGQALIDSLLRELPKAPDDTGKVNVLTALSFSYSFINPDEGIRYGEQSLDLAAKLQWKKGMAWANSRLGVNYRGKSEHQKALEYFSKALTLFREIGANDGIEAVDGNMGNVCYDQGDYPKALEYYSQALNMAEEIGDKRGMARAANGIGNVYQAQSDYAKALQFFLKALKIAEDSGDEADAANVTGNIGYIYKEQGEYTRALEYDFRALKMEQDAGNKNNTALITGDIGSIYCDGLKDYTKGLEYFFMALRIDEESGNRQGIARMTGNIGEAYSQIGNYTEAVVYHFRALRMDVELGYKDNEGLVLENIGWNYLSMVLNPGLQGKGNSIEPRSMPLRPDSLLPKGRSALLRKAVEYFNKSISVDREINSLNNLQHSYRGLATADSMLGDIEGAYSAYMQYAHIKDSVFSEESLRKIARAEMQKKEEEDSLTHAQEHHDSELRYRQQRNYTYVGIAGVLVLLGFSFFMLRNNKLLSKEKKRSDDLLRNILPADVAEELKVTGTSEPRDFDNVTVLFTDFVNFTQASEKMKAKVLIDELHTCFMAFDQITAKYGIEKIKTIGDAYLAAAGVPMPDPKHAEHVVGAAIEIRDYMADRFAKLGNNTFQIRIGVHSGGVVAGIVGIKKFAYDIWGDTVNTAARMEQRSEAGRINISETTYDLVKNKYTCEYRGEIDAKNKGMMKMYYVN